MEKTIIGLLSLLIVSHTVALVYKLYWFIWWLDMPMHFMGGFSAALIFFWFFGKFPEYFNLWKNFLITLIFVLSWVALVGVFWEFLEFLCNVLILSKDNLPTLQILWLADTLKDLSFDLIGGLSLSVIMNFRFKKLNQ